MVGDISRPLGLNLSNQIKTFLKLAKHLKISENIFKILNTVKILYVSSSYTASIPLSPCVYIPNMSKPVIN